MTKYLKLKFFYGFHLFFYPINFWSKKLALVMLLIFPAFSILIAQNVEIDSLNNVLQLDVHDTTRLAIMKKLLPYSPPDKRSYYVDRMINFATKKWKEDNTDIYSSYIASGYVFKSETLSIDGKIDSAILVIQKASKIFKSIGKFKEEGNCQVVLGSYYISQGNYLEAIDLFYTTMSLFEKINHPMGVGDININIARIYYKQNNYEKAISFLNEAIRSYEKVDYSLGLVDIYSKLTTIYLAWNKEPEAIKTLENAVDFIQKVGTQNGLYYEEMLNSNLGNLHFLKKEMKLAIQFYEASIKVAESIGNLYPIAYRKLEIAKAYFSLKNYQKAESIGNEALRIAQERSEKDLEASVTKFLGEVYEKLNKYQLAYQMQKTYLILQEEVRKEKDERQIIEQQFKYEYAKKELIANVEQEKKILELDLLAKEKDAQKNRWIAILLASFLILLMIAYFIYQSQKQKNTIAIQHSNLLKQKLLSSQMNPHFIFNSLNAIQNFIIKNNSLQASIYLSKFSEMIRMILNFSRKDYITLEAELKFLNHYLELQQLRSEQNFEYSFEIEEEVETDTILVPPMLAQPFIENAVEHGGFNQDRKGHILISFRIQNEQLVCVVEDDGIGLKKSQEMKIDAQQKHESLALTITKERLETLFGAKNEKYQIDLVDKKDITPSKTGTKAIFSIPLKVA